MEGNGKAVRLIANMLQHEKPLRSARKNHRIRVPWNPYFLQAFGQTDKRHIHNTKLIKYFLGCINLWRATINDEQLRWVSKPPALISGKLFHLLIRKHRGILGLVGNGTFVLVMTHKTTPHHLRNRRNIV